MHENDIILAHKFSSNHQTALMRDKTCGCFHCLRIFTSSEITDWIHDNEDKTALCPYCGIDSVIGNSSGYPITKDFLSKMNQYWFNGYVYENRLSR